MTKIKLLLTFLFLQQMAFGQISILNADMPKANDTLRYSTSTSTFNYQSTDSNYTWNFANIKIDNQDVQHYYTPSQTPYVLNFFSSANYGIPEPSQALGPLGGTASNMFSFYKASTNSLLGVGRGATIQNIPLGINYLPKDTLYKYPLTYGASYSGNFAGEASFLSLGTLKQSGTRNTIVDGWGSITTPFGTFACIRVKSTLVSNDSVIFNGIGIPIPSSRTEYTWLAKTQGFPVMEVVVNNLTSTVSSIRFKDRYRPEAYVNNCNFTANRTSAKVGDTITLNNTSFGKPKSFNWLINPNTFTYVAGSSAASEFPKVIFNAGAKYSVKLTVTYEGGADDTTKLDYISIGVPVLAAFDISNVHPAINETITLSDLSTGNPTSWLWTITPGSGWAFANGTTNASQNPKLQFITAGTYSIQLRASNGAQMNTLKKDNIIQVWSTGLNQLNESQTWDIFPNPGKNFIQVKLTNPALTEIRLFTILGQPILSKTLDPTVDIGFSSEELPRGLYLLELVQDQQRKTIRLVLE